MALKVRQDWLFSGWLINDLGVTEGVEKASIDDEKADKKDRTVVKDKSAKLEAKLEREIKKKMVVINNILQPVLSFCLGFSRYNQTYRKNKEKECHHCLWLRYFRCRYEKSSQNVCQ